MTDNPSLDQRYFEWLYQKVAPLNDRNPAHTYFHLLEQLYKREFVSRVPNDDNRAEDSRELRWEFLGEYDIPEEIRHWAMMDASMLEVFIALGERMAFSSEGAPSYWFWHVLDNLGLMEFQDAYYTDRAYAIIEGILDRVIHRTYSPNGQGGMFPLRHPRGDQRHVELWYQMSAYLLEKTV